MVTTKTFEKIIFISNVHMGQQTKNYIELEILQICIHYLVLKGVYMSCGFGMCDSSDINFVDWRF